jgi:hypothetical protein
LAQRDVDLFGLQVGQRGQRRLADLLEVLLEVAVLVEVPDDERGQALVALGEARERDLREQVLLQRRLRGGELREVVAVLVVRAGARSRAVLVGETVVVGEGSARAPG